MEEESSKENKSVSFLYIDFHPCYCRNLEKVQRILLGLGKFIYYYIGLLFTIAINLQIKGYYLNYKKHPLFMVFQVSIAYFFPQFILFISSLYLLFSQMPLKLSWPQRTPILSTISVIPFPPAGKPCPTINTLDDNSGYANNISQVNRIEQNNRENMKNIFSIHQLCKQLHRGKILHFVLDSTTNIFIKIYVGEKSYIDTYFSFHSQHVNNTEYYLSHSLISWWLQLSTEE